MVATVEKTYDKGDTVRCSGAFKNRVGTVIDPASVFFAFLDPNGVETIYTYGVDAALVKDTAGTATPITGSYYVDLDANVSGTYQWRLYSTGSGKAAEERKFFVAFSDF